MNRSASSGGVGAAEEAVEVTGSLVSSEGFPPVCSLAAASAPLRMNWRRRLWHHIRGNGGLDSRLEGGCEFRPGLERQADESVFYNWRGVDPKGV